MLHAVQRFYTDQKGSFILSSTITIIALTVLIGYLANMGAETIEREKLQHAADAAAYSSAVVLARGMNTVCTLEHVIGELTAYCVIFEALVGPEKGFSPCKEEKEMDTILKFCRTLSPHPKIPADRQYVKWIIDLFEHDKYNAGAACYDAEMTLKYYMLVCMSLKAKANTLQILTYLPYVGQIVEVALMAIHAVADLALAYIVYEYLIIRGYDTLFGGSVSVSNVMKTYWRTVKIPSLENQLHNTVGSASGNADQPIPYAIRNIEEKMRAHYELESVVSAPRDTFLPLSSLGGVSLSLPILPHLPLLCEAGPTKTAGSDYLSKLDSEPWVRGASGSHPYDRLPELPWKGTDKTDGMIQNVMDTMESVDQMIGIVTPVVKGLIAAFKYSPRKRDRRRAKVLQGHLNDLSKFDNVSRYKPGRYGYRNNPSVWSYPVGTFDYDKEKRTQWVRASYPVIDSLRSGLRPQMSGQIPLSNMSTYMTAWSYRYALSESYYLRSADKRPYGTVSIPYSLALPMIALSGPNIKGNEFWTTPLVGSPFIDDMFTVIVAVEDRKKTPFSSGVYSRSGQKRGNIAFAQAMYYNASGRAAHKILGNLISKDDATQPDTAWDTLQWMPENPRIQPTLTAPEWWNAKPSKGPNSWTILDVLNSTSPTLDTAKIHLNWQAMLVPVSKRRLERFGQTEDASEEARKAAQFAAENHTLMSH